MAVAVFSHANLILQNLRPKHRHSRSSRSSARSKLPNPSPENSKNPAFAFSFLAHPPPPANQWSASLVFKTRHPGSRQRRVVHAVLEIRIEAVMVQVQKNQITQRHHAHIRQGMLEPMENKRNQRQRLPKPQQVRESTSTHLTSFRFPRPLFVSSCRHTSTRYSCGTAGIRPSLPCGTRRSTRSCSIKSLENSSPSGPKSAGDTLSRTTSLWARFVVHPFPPAS